MNERSWFPVQSPKYGVFALLMTPQCYPTMSDLSQAVRALCDWVPTGLSVHAHY